MANTFAEAATQMKNGIHWLETLREAAQGDLLTFEDVFIQSLEGNLAVVSGMLGAMSGNRASVSAGLDGEALVVALLENFRVVIGAPDSDFDSYMLFLRQYMDTNSQSVNSRAIVRGAVSLAGGNTGDGTIIRYATSVGGVATDTVESSGLAEVITLKITSDQNTGASKHQEVWEMRGVVSGDDELDRELTGRGSGSVVEITAKSADDSLIGNASFSGFSGTAGTPTAITDFTITNSIGNVEIDQTNYYRETAIEAGTPGALKITATETIAQALTVRGTNLVNNVVYVLQIAYNRAINSDAGTLAIHAGGTSTSVVLSAQTGWNVLRVTFEMGSASTEENFDVKVVWTRTGGTGLLVDDFILTPFTEAFESVPVMALSGETPWLIGDTGTFTDTETGAVIQRWIARATGRYLVSNNAGGETITDP